MKTRLTLVLSLLALSAFACSDHLYRLALNQRSFYNPAALCPYCKGSSFISAGFTRETYTENGGFFFALGNDGLNRVHGPWDYSFSHSEDEAMKVNGYALRYAWMQEFGKWRLAGGIRVSYFDLRIKTFLEEQSSADIHANLWDLDAGAMLTNTKGIYIGISAQHLPNSEIKTKGPQEQQVSVSMKRNYALMTGAVIPLKGKFDLMTDANAMYDGENFAVQPGTMLRYNHSLALGGGMLMEQNAFPQFELRGGYTSARFKWLFTAAPAKQGWCVETGLVFRFGYFRDRFALISNCANVSGACTGAPPRPYVLGEFGTHE